MFIYTFNIARPVFFSIHLHNLYSPSSDVPFLVYDWSNLIYEFRSIFSLFCVPLELFWAKVKFSSISSISLKRVSTILIYLMSRLIEDKLIFSSFSPTVCIFLCWLYSYLISFTWLHYGNQAIYPLYILRTFFFISILVF